MSSSTILAFVLIISVLASLPLRALSAYSQQIMSSSRFLEFVLITSVLASWPLRALSAHSQRNSTMGGRGFVAPLIHRTSPQSPFYNPNATHDDIVMEDLHISAARASYFSRRPYEPSLFGVVAPVSREFVMAYNIGTPAFQTFTLPDSGSDLIWLQCRPCWSCFKQKGNTPIFDSRNSTTFQKIGCKQPECPRDFSCSDLTQSQVCSYRMEYGDNTTPVGIIAKENITISTLNLPSILFGCGISNADPLKVGIPGALGLSNSSISLIGQLNETAFSYCQNSDQTGGWIRFGSAAVLVGGKTPLVPNKDNLYHLILEGVKVAGKQPATSANVFPMGDEFNDFIIDSGTTYTTLEPLVVNAMVEAIKILMDEEEYEPYENIGPWPLCYDLKTNPGLRIDLPNIDFMFKDLTFGLTTDNAWVPVRGGFLCLAMVRGEPNQVSILGSYQQRSVNVGYDLKEGQVWMKYQNRCQE